MRGVKRTEGGGGGAPAAGGANYDLDHPFDHRVRWEGTGGGTAAAAGAGASAAGIRSMRRTLASERAEQAERELYEEAYGRGGFGRG